MPAPIHIVGHVCVDLTPALLGTYLGQPGELVESGPLGVRTGGTVANCARVVAALGGDVQLGALVGNDALGDMCVALLESEHPGRVSLERTSAAATSYSVVVAPPGKDRTFWHHTGANDEFRGDIDVIPGAIMHFGYPTLCPGMCEGGGAPTIDLFTRARRAGGLTSLDLAYLADNSPLQSLDWHAYLHSVMAVTDIFCPSVDDLTSCLHMSGGGREVAEALAAEFIEAGAAIVLITLGKDGSYLATGTADRLAKLTGVCAITPDQWANISHYEPAAPIDAPEGAPLDTNGAGDTFKAAFLVALSRGFGPTEATHFASTTVARRIAGQPLIPSADSALVNEEES
ncbi:MAG: carbohydrate kinase family protein [Actinomycetaceae bacterium]|nr:carbohydrate kinase family protein [Actinomycetaceae bacterium]